MNIGEFLAIVDGMRFLEKQATGGRQQVVNIIYSDSRNAMAWVRDRQVRTQLKISEKNKELFDRIDKALDRLRSNAIDVEIRKWETKARGEIPADFGRK